MDDVVKVVTDATFEAEVLKAPTPVVVDFWAPWCQPCKTLAPQFEQAARAFGPKVRFVKVDVSQNSQMAQAFQVQALPTVIAVKGGKVAGALTGGVTAKALDDLVRKVA